MERRFAAIIGAVVGSAALVVVGWTVLGPEAVAPEDDAPEVVVAAPEPVPQVAAPEPEAVEPPHPWAQPAPEAPERPEAEPGTWAERRAQAHEAWRARSLEAIAQLTASWTEAERAAVVSATETLIDTIGTARRETEAGERTPAELRADTSAARATADEAFRAAVGDRADEVWGALNAASTPI